MAAKLTWTIPTRSRRCSLGQELFTPDGSYFTLLQESESGCFQRDDYCAACWQQMQTEQKVPADATFWRAVIPSRKDTIKDQEELGERVLELLREASTQPEQADEAFVLGLYLARLRKAAARQEIQREGQTFTLYEVLETSEVLCVPRVPLSRLEVGNLQNRIAHHLKGEEL